MLKIHHGPSQEIQQRLIEKKKNIIKTKENLKNTYG